MKTTTKSNGSRKDNQPKGRWVVQAFSAEPGSKDAELEYRSQLNSITRSQAEKEIRHLATMAKHHDIDALEKLARVAAYATNLLNEIAASDRDYVREFSKKEVFWPVVYEPPYKSYHKKLKAYVADLKLGEAPHGWTSVLYHQLTDRKMIIAIVQKAVIEYQYHCSWESEREVLGKTWGTHLAEQLAPETKMPELFAEIKDKDFLGECLDLKPLDEDNWESWLRIIKKFLVLITDGHPEQHEPYRSIGKFREKHGGAELGTPQAEQNIRDGLWMELKANLKRWAGVKKAPKKSPGIKRKNKPG